MPTKVTITTGQHTVTVEHDTSCAHDVAALARKIWDETKDPRDARKADSTGFSP